MTKCVKRIMKTWILAFGVSVLAACVSLPGGQKKAFIMTSRSQEAQMGREAYAQILQKEKILKANAGPQAARWNAMLQRVGKRIAQQAPVSDFEWEFTLIESPEMNAFCLPGGKVAFYTGIMKVLENESAMALVMGHEVAHAVLRHGGQRMTQGLVLQGGLTVLDATVLKDSSHRDLALGLMGVGAQVGVLLPFSRAHESEADSAGLRYSAVAGYDPAEAPRFWKRFAEATSQGGKPPEFLSTHPADQTRIRNLEALQSEVRPLYEGSPHYGLGEKI